MYTHFISYSWSIVILPVVVRVYSFHQFQLDYAYFASYKLRMPISPLTAGVAYTAACHRGVTTPHSNYLAPKKDVENIPIRTILRPRLKWDI